MYEQLTLDNENNVLKSLHAVLEYLKQCKHDTSIVSSYADIFSKPKCDGDISDLLDIIGIKDYYPPEGKHICELLNIKNVLKNDLYIVSENPCTLSSASKHISYTELSAQLFEDIFKKLGVHTMAYEPKYRYAISSHNHDSIYPRVSYAKNPSYDTATDISTIGTLTISTDYLSAGSYDDIDDNPANAQTSSVTYKINVPKIVVPLPPKPMIGTLRFVGIQTI